MNRRQKVGNKYLMGRACGAVVGTEELISVMYMLDKIAAKLGVRFDR
jgi:hypothetical protein